jgi:glycosyltransferase involved in cell wall biosynthesis
VKVLVVGWFSFEQGHVTAGDLLARDLVCDWLREAGRECDVAVDPPFTDGINWRHASPGDYSHIVFVCGPFQNGELEQVLRRHFRSVPLIGVNLSMVLPLKDYNPFLKLFERDSTRDARPDIVFATNRPHVPVVGVCLVEPYDAGRTDITNPAIQRLLDSREVSIVNIDTRLDVNTTGQRTPAEIESLLARMDVVITTRLHGTVLSLKNGVPTVAIDPEKGGFKIVRQAEIIGWPVVFSVDKMTDERLQQAFDYCLTAEARQKAAECTARAKELLEPTHAEFVTLMQGDALSMSTTSKPTVCVAIASYNQGRYLAEAIQSVLDQTHPVDEIIVVDDGSTDDSAEIAKQCEQVQLVQQTNQGLAAARNTGWRTSKSEFILFLDADDRLLPKSIELGLKHFADNPDCVCVFGHYRYIREDGVPSTEWPQAPIDKDYYEALLRGNCIGMQATVLYRQRVVEEAGGYNETLPACEDYDLNLRLAKEYPLHRYNEIVAEYRQHGKNMSSDISLMLPTVLSVLRSHAPDGSDTKRMKAFNAGIRGWRSYYCRKYFESARDNPQLRANGRCTLLRHAPLVTLQIVMRHWLGQLAALPRRTLQPNGLVGRAVHRLGRPNIGKVKLGDLDRLTPLNSRSAVASIEQHYVSNFIAENAHHVLGNRKCTILFDLRFEESLQATFASAENIVLTSINFSKKGAEEELEEVIRSLSGSETLECVVVLHCLSQVYDLPEGIRRLEKSLVPQGSLLATFPGTGHFGSGDQKPYWGLTPFAAERIVTSNFKCESCTVKGYGNVLTAIGMLHSIDTQELSAKELSTVDPQYPFVVGVKAVKA